MQRLAIGERQTSKTLPTCSRHKGRHTPPLHPSVTLMGLDPRPNLVVPHLTYVNNPLHLSKTGRLTKLYFSSVNQ